MNGPKNSRDLECNMSTSWEPRRHRVVRVYWRSLAHKTRPTPSLSLSVCVNAISPSRLRHRLVSYQCCVILFPVDKGLVNRFRFRPEKWDKSFKSFFKRHLWLGWKSFARKGWGEKMLKIDGRVCVCRHTRLENFWLGSVHVRSVGLGSAASKGPPSGVQSSRAKVGRSPSRRRAQSPVRKGGPGWCGGVRRFLWNDGVPVVVEGNKSIHTHIYIYRYLPPLYPPYSSVLSSLLSLFFFLGQHAGPSTVSGEVYGDWPIPAGFFF